MAKQPKRSPVYRPYPNWDRDVFGVMMRRIEIHLMRGDVDTAKTSFETLVEQTVEQTVGGRPEKHVRKKLTLMSPVEEAFDAKTAGMLQEHGYENVLAVHRARDEDLLSYRGVGLIVVRKIREIIEEVLNGERLEISQDWVGQEPDWELATTAP